MLGAWSPIVHQEKWSVERMHSLEKAPEQRRFTACYHGADSDALAIYKYANTTVTWMLGSTGPLKSIGFIYLLIMLTMG